MVYRIKEMKSKLTINCLLIIAKHLPCSASTQISLYVLEKQKKKGQSLPFKRELKKITGTIGISYQKYTNFDKQDQKLSHEIYWNLKTS